jgi:hypothetical protein
MSLLAAVGLRMSRTVAVCDGKVHEAAIVLLSELAVMPQEGAA